MRQLLFLLTISVGLAGLIFFELQSRNDLPETELTRTATDQGEPAVQSNQAPRVAPHPTANDSVPTILARPLFSPSRRPETAKSEGPADPTLNDVRLSGIVIEPDRRLAIFAVRDCQEFRAGLGMMGAKEAVHAATQRTSHS